MTSPNDLPPSPGEDTAPPLKVQLLELSVFLFLVVPSLLISFSFTGEMGGGFISLAFATIFRDLALVGLILYFLWRNGEPRLRIGWVRPFPWGEMGIGVLLFLPFFFGTGLLAGLLKQAGLSAPSNPLPPALSPHGAGAFALAFLLVLVVAVAEETIFRGYLILRLRAVTGSTTVAVFLSSLLFSLGHGYEGNARMAAVFVMGVILALVYLWRRSIVAPMVMHFLQDFIALMAVPFLTHWH